MAFDSIAIKIQEALSDARRHHSQPVRRNTPRLKMRAAHHGRSAEAEMRDILEAAIRPANRIRIVPLWQL